MFVFVVNVKFLLLFFCIKKTHASIIKLTLEDGNVQEASHKV